MEMENECDHLEEILQTWDQAGERPYEVLKELNMLETLMDKLNRSNFQLDESIILYRGSSRNQELVINDVKIYEYPTSWTFSEDIALRFVDDCENRVIFRLSGERILNALENNHNSYGEEEVIIAPFNVTITSKDIIDGVIYFDAINTMYEECMKMLLQIYEDVITIM